MKNILHSLLIGLIGLAMLPSAALADSLSIEAWATGQSLSAQNLNSRQTTIQNLINGNLDNSNIQSDAGIVGSKLDLTTGTGRIANSTSVTSDTPIFTSAQTWSNAATTFSGWRLSITNTNSASTSRLIDLQVDSTVIASISRVGQLYINSQNYASGPRTLMDGAWLNIASAPYPDNVTAASGTAPRFMAYAFQRPAVAAANSSVTTTNAATVFIASAPVAGDNMTLTNRYALWVDQGDVRIGGNVFASGSTTIDGSIVAKSNLRFDSTTPSIRTGTTALAFHDNAGANERMRLTDGGILALGTTNVTNVQAGELVLANAKYIRGLLQDGTDSSNLIGLDTNNSAVVGGGSRMVLVGYLAAASLPAGAANLNGGLVVDSTNNRWIFYSGGNRYYIAGTSF